MFGNWTGSGWKPKITSLSKRYSDTWRVQKEKRVGIQRKEDAHEARKADNSWNQKWAKQHFECCCSLLKWKLINGYGSQNQHLQGS